MPELIIIDITENEEFLLDEYSNKKEIKGSGKIVIKNPSKKSKLWNLVCDFKETVNTTIDSREIEIGILSPSQEYIINYDIQNLKKPSLEITESFETYKEIINEINYTSNSHNINEYKLLINLINPLNYSITNVNISRKIPENFEDINIKTPKVGMPL